MAKYKCEICGYTYDEETEGVKFDSLPSEWTCPICGAPKEMFKREDSEKPEEKKHIEIEKLYGAAAYRDTCARLSYGLFAMTSIDGDKPVGCIANVCVQTTGKPLTVAICLNHDNYTNVCIKKYGRVCVNILPEKCPPEIIGRFGFKSSRDTDKFADTLYEMRNGLPVLGAACAYISGTVKGSIELSTHTLFSVEVDDAGLLSGDAPMTYAYYHDVVKGTVPKNAPSADLK